MNKVHDGHRQRMKDRFAEYEFDGFAEHEILEFLLYFAVPLKNTNELAHNLLNRFGSFDAVLDADSFELESVKGVGKHVAFFLKSFAPAFNAYAKAKAEKKKHIKGYYDACEYAKLLFKGIGHEEFFVLCLDSKSDIIAQKKISSGSASKTQVVIRSITDFVLKNACNKIVVSHNHPQGDAKPSDEDIAFTSTLFSSCVLNDIDVVDHIIVAGDEALSFGHDGVLEPIKRDAFEKLGVSNKSEIYKRCLVANKDNGYDY